MKRIVVALGLPVLLGTYSLIAFDVDRSLHRKLSSEIDGLHREILNLNQTKDQILLSPDYNKSPKRVEVEKIVDEVNNLRYQVVRLTKQMGNLNVPQSTSVSAESAP